jgi:hypothetical protein
MTSVQRSARAVLAAAAALSLAISGLTTGVSAQAACDPMQTTPEYAGDVRTSDEVIGFPLGSQEVTSEESDTYLEAVDQDSDRVTSGTAATSVGGRPIKFALVGRPENVSAQGLADLKQDIAALRDPSTPATEAAELAASTPAILWVASNVHGTEESGTDASLQVLYDLADRVDCAAQRILDNAVVVVLPIQNPDGREEETRRNLYGFDMNRDWFARTQPETDGKIELLREYPGQLFLDVHEMGTRTYFFPPNADPIYHEVSDESVDWINDVYGANIAAEFDRQDIPYFHYDPYDFFAMIYGDTVPGEGFLGAGMTFEKHSGDPIAQRTYEQYVAIWISLSHASIEKDRILTEWHASYSAAFTQGKAGRLEPNFVQESDSTLYQQVPSMRVRHYFIRDDDPSKAREVQRLVRRLQRMDVEVLELTAPVTVPDFRAYGRPAGSETLPAGTYWIPMAQAQKHWIQALMHEDPYIPVDVTYDVSAWSNPLLMNVPAGFSGAKLSPTASAVPLLPEPPPPTLPAEVPSVALMEPVGTTGFESAGHARYLFERVWDLPYTLITPDEIAGGALADHDVLVVPDGYVPWTLQAMGQRGKRALVDWVNQGGRYIGYQGGAQVAARLGITTAALNQSHTNMPGSLVRVSLDTSSPLSAGVGPFAYVMFENDLVMTRGRGSAPVTYPAAGSPDFFVSGLAEGAESLAGTSAVVDEAVGGGRAVVFSTSPNFRAWSDGTQKILWNAILGPDPVSGTAAAIGSPQRSQAEEAARSAALALPNLTSPIGLSVARADAEAATGFLQAYGPRLVKQGSAGATTFLIDNPKALALDEHPFAATLIRDLAVAGIEITSFHMS